jgi:hypothetical protein
MDFQVELETVGQHHFGEGKAGAGKATCRIEQLACRPRNTNLFIFVAFYR